MRLSLKQKQVLGVTAMVALVVIALSLLHLINLARVLLRRKPGPRRAAGQRRLSPGARGRHRSGHRVRRGPHQPQRAVGARGGDLFAGRDRRGDRRSGGHRDRVQRSDAGGHRPWRRARPLNNLIAESGLGAAAGRLQHRAVARMEPADRARRQAVRRDPHRPVDDAGPPRSQPVAGAGGGGGGHRAAGGGAGRDAAGAGRAAADARDPQQPVAARAAATWARRSICAMTPSSGTSATCSTRSARSCAPPRPKGSSPRSSPSCRGASPWSAGSPPASPTR